MEPDRIFNADGREISPSNSWSISKIFKLIIGLVLAAVLLIIAFKILWFIIIFVAIGYAIWFLYKNVLK